MFYPSLTGDALEAYNKATNVIFETAQLELGMTPDKLVIRDLRFSDLGRTLSSTVGNANNWNALLPAGGTFAAWVNVSISDTQFINVFGVALQSRNTSITNVDLEALEEIRLTRGGKLLRIWPVRILANDFGSIPRIWFADDPVTVSQNINLTVDLVSSAIGTLDVVLLGRVVEPDSKTINK